MGEEVARVLALPLLWASLVSPGSFDYDLIPVPLKQCIMRAYSDAGGNVAVNPVERVQSGLHNMTADSTRKEFAAIHSQLFGMLRQMATILNELFRSRAESQRNHQQALAVARRIAVQPVARRVQSEEATAAIGTRQGVKLSKRPKDFYELWGDYEFGLEGLKPARDFTTAERSANMFAFSRRKLFWDVVAGFVRAGFTSDVAIR
ncbi:hypothetical protein P3T76_004959 [Phytophthora citrophthora]|uniref:Uncharacterized protein n=1 Tax=Phytophthora citrophthora TaxID=4793 RepID=A0AAD9GSU3_9STRA|nr:hypothetical protein P3T76_004959 [Phytophthora citrophthora]